MSLTFCYLSDLIAEALPFFILDSVLYCEYAGVSTGFGEKIGKVGRINSSWIDGKLEVIVQLTGLDSGSKYHLEANGVSLYKDSLMTEHLFTDEEDTDYFARMRKMAIEEHAALVDHIKSM